MGSIIICGRKRFECNSETLQNTKANRVIIDENDNENFNEMEDAFDFWPECTEKSERRVSYVKFSEEVHTVTVNTEDQIQDVHISRLRTEPLCQLFVPDLREYQDPGDHGHKGRYTGNREHRRNSFPENCTSFHRSQILRPLPAFQ